MRLRLTRLAWLCWGVIILLAIVMHAIGNRSPWMSLLLYGPLSYWLIALIVLGVCAIPLSHRLTVVCAVTALFFAGPLWEYRTHHPAIPLGTAPTLRVTTCNRGQHNGHSLASFISEQQPDVIAFQESNEIGNYVPSASEFNAYPHRSRISEFQMLSKLPFLKASLVGAPQIVGEGAMQTWFKAARFEVQTSRGPAAIYAVHLISPRDEIRSLVAGTPMKPDKQKAIEYFSRNQQLLVTEALTMAESDPLPVIMCGDFNVPPLGPLYRRMTKKLQDSHTQAGVGYGFTFPGDMRAPLTGGQWLRIDYVLASSDWEVLRCEVEQQFGSQHSAVASVLRLR